MTLKHIIISSLLFISFKSFSQFGIKLNSEEALESYTLFETSFSTFLIDNCGEIVNQWENVFRTDLHARLLPNGNLIYIKDNAVIERDWNDNLVRITNHGQSDLMLNYEVLVLPNGNYLCLARRIRSMSFFTNKGYDVNFPQYDDSVVEMIPGTGRGCLGMGNKRSCYSRKKSQCW